MPRPALSHSDERDGMAMTRLRVPGTCQPPPVTKHSNGAVSPVCDNDSNRQCYDRRSNDISKSSQGPPSSSRNASSGRAAAENGSFSSSSTQPGAGCDQRAADGGDGRRDDDTDVAGRQRGVACEGIGDGAPYRVTTPKEDVDDQKCRASPTSQPGHDRTRGGQDSTSAGVDHRIDDDNNGGGTEGAGACEVGDYRSNADDLFAIKLPVRPSSELYAPDFEQSNDMPSAVTVGASGGAKGTGRQGEIARKASALVLTCSDGGTKRVSDVIQTNDSTHSGVHHDGRDNDSTPTGYPSDVYTIAAGGTARLDKQHLNTKKNSREVHSIEVRKLRLSFVYHHREQEGNWPLSRRDAPTPKNHPSPA